jgi:hypothetical protein
MRWRVGRSYGAVVGIVLVLGGAAAAAAPRWWEATGPDTATAAGAVTDGIVPAAPAAPVLGRLRTYRVGPDVDPTGTRDVTDALLAFFRRVPDGSRVLFPARSRYRIDGTVELDGRSRLLVDGGGSEFFATTAGDPNRAHWRLVGGSDLELRNLSIRGANGDGGTPAAYRPDRQWQHGVDLRGVRRVLLDRVTVTDLYGDCVYVGAAPTGGWSEDVRVRAARCARNGRQGLAVTAGRRVALQGGSFAQISLMTVDLEPNGPSGGAADIRVSGNRVAGQSRQQFIGIGGVGPVSRVRIEDNVLTGKPLTVLVVSPGGQPRTDLAVLDNRSDTADDRPFSASLVFQRVRGLRVEGNLAPLSGPDMALVQLTCSSGVTVGGNTYPGGAAQVRSAGSRCD